MTDWNALILAHHAAAHADGDFELIASPGATDEAINQLASELRVSFPDEFASLYTAADGWGCYPAGQPAEVSWLFRPLEQIPQFCEAIRAWFADTHPEFTDRFVPFIDFDNGDGLGYFYEANGTIMEGLFCFEHEAYEADEAQDINEFVTSAPISIRQFIEMSGE